MPPPYVPLILRMVLYHSFDKITSESYNKAHEVQKNTVPQGTDWKTAMRLEFIVSENEDGARLGAFLRSRQVSAGLIKQVKYTQQGILVNGVRTNTNQPVFAGQKVEFFLQDEQSELSAEPMVLDIVRQTEHFAVINKPAGMVVHPTLNHEAGTLANGWMSYLAAKGQTGVFRPVNRIDRDTSGLVLCAKNSYAAPILAQEVEKVYLAVATGEMPLGKGVIDLPIARCGDSIIKREVAPHGQPSITEYEVLAAGNGYSVLRIHLVTGRTHQIRVHMAALGYPLAGDWLYACGQDRWMNRQALHCFAMKIPAIGSTASEWVCAAPPQDMQQLYRVILGGISVQNV